MNPSPWNDSTGSLALPQRAEVHLWSARLDDEDPGQFLEFLSPDERSRAGRFADPRPARRFINARGILRRLLGRYLAEAPGSLVFQYGLKGKPALRIKPPAPVSFNLSHSEGLAVYAFSGGGELGVDIEKIHPVPEIDEISGCFFSPDECRRLTARLEEKQARFFEFWTCKEAVIKASGFGMGFPTREFTVDLDGAGPRLKAAPFDLTLGKACRLALLQPGEGYRGALAVFDTDREQPGRY